MKTCATCKYFGGPHGIDMFDEASDDYVESRHHTCVRVIHGNGTRPHGKRVTEELAVVTDGSGYAARLCVLPEFGCVLHEERKAPCGEEAGR